jgi:hypothetical protein
MESGDEGRFTSKYTNLDGLPMHHDNAHSGGRRQLTRTLMIELRGDSSFLKDDNDIERVTLCWRQFEVHGVVFTLGNTDSAPHAAFPVNIVQAVHHLERVELTI